MHMHSDMHEIFYIVKGEGNMVINGAEFPIQGGDCVLVSAGDTHEIANTGDVDLVVCYFGVEEYRWL